ncbi:3-hydroxyisobutyrate dehydrogenase [Phytophthora cinnamomi]|uniref:3-hydroxyisobutyrate dehydrogenase n=1 Tax=Phytophthora cinnamomi TaxID=4785 RepID=UPI00355A48F5|nr:3-hydroxyisobutyrate dehydrogenase [Phytophthora cinnamomi]
MASTSNKSDVPAAASTTTEVVSDAAGSVRSAQASEDGAAATEPLVKKRRTKNFQLREDLARSRGCSTVAVPAFEPHTFDSWDAFIAAWAEYTRRTKTMYRRRSSSTTAYWNNKHKFKKYPVPEDFKYATMAYWCTHGCIQPSRSNGVRTHLHNRYTGCSARITADVVYEAVDGEPGKVRWLVRVRNQIAQHNHRISDEIFHCYTNNSSVPDELLLGPDAVDLHQKQETQHVTEESAYEPSTRILTELDPMGVDPGFTMRSSPESKVSAKTTVITTTPSGPVAGFVLKEALANDHKMNMAASEMQPLFDELKNTPSRVIHKRLQDVSEMVAHLQAKWHQDRIAEEAAQAHAIGPITSLSVEQAAAGPNEPLGKAAVNAISTITSLPPGSAFYLTPQKQPATDISAHDKERDKARDEDAAERSSLLKTLTDLSALTSELLGVYEASPEGETQSAELKPLTKHAVRPDGEDIGTGNSEGSSEILQGITTQKTNASSEVAQLRKLVMKLKEASDAKDDMLLFLDGKVRRLEQLVSE